MTLLSIVSRKVRIRLLWIGLGILALIIASVFDNSPTLVEMVYGKGLFPLIRYAFDYSVGLLPFPVLWIVVPFVLWRFWQTAIIPARRRSVTWGSFILGLLSTAGAVIFLFYFLWGFNYSREDIVSRMQLSAEPLDMKQLESEFERATLELSKLAQRYEHILGQRMSLVPDDLESQIRRQTEEVLRNLGFPVHGRVRGRLLAPKGILLFFNTAGIYIPFSGEGHVDAGMLPVQVPFTMSHEMSHGLGVTDEGDCNFLAFLACMRSEDPVIRYSGLLSYWRYVAAEYRRVFPQAYAEHFVSLPDLVRQSLVDIRKNLDKYPEIMPRFRNAVYDSYLKTHGVHDGLKSYSRIVRMVRAFYQMESATQ